MENEEILKKLDSIERMLFSQKKVLTLKEAAKYSGRSESDLYKKTSLQLIPHYKPEGKIIYFDRDELEGWCLRNAVKTKDKIDGEASTYIAIGK